MKIANKSILTSFMRKHTDTVGSLNRWLELVEHNDISNHNELKSIFPTADYVGNSRYVFNFKGNKCRLVVLVVFINGFMQIRFCGTHKEYDKIRNIENL